MNKLKQFAQKLMASTLFWLFWIFSGLIGFIMYFERPLSFIANKIYPLF